ncbi:MAG TPA: hypothetical protein VFM88_15430 [Vicinamibacteria bacterium]|nr:hypothetical protein [Vicinamibacteria bacterium]
MPRYRSRRRQELRCRRRQARRALNLLLLDDDDPDVMDEAAAESPVIDTEAPRHDRDLLLAPAGGAERTRQP